MYSKLNIKPIYFTAPLQSNLYSGSFNAQQEKFDYKSDWMMNHKIIWVLIWLDEKQWKCHGHFLKIKIGVISFLIKNNYMLLKSESLNKFIQVVALGFFPVPLAIIPLTYSVLNLSWKQSAVIRFAS